MRPLAVAATGVIAAAAALACLPALASAAAGDLDPTFGGDGIVESGPDICGPARAVILQPDRKIVAAGGSCTDFVVARYNPDGSPDTTFSGDGRETTRLEGQLTGAYALALQPDGKIVAAGTSYGTRASDFDFDGSGLFVLIRYNSDGTLDRSFSADGKQTTDFAGKWDDAARAVIVQPSGKIVAVGTRGQRGLDDVAIARYRPDGSLDASFSGDGRKTTDLGRCNRGSFGALAAAQHPDGKLVVAASELPCRDRAGNPPDLVVLRYLRDGRLDRRFSRDGKSRAPVYTGGEKAGLALQPDGRIVVAGADPTGEFRVARLRRNGSLDKSFSGNGVQRTGFLPGFDVGSSHDRATAVAVQPDGKIVAAGHALRGGLPNGGAQPYLAVARYNRDGSPDAGFCGDGRQLIDRLDGAEAIVTQGDGKPLAAGSGRGGGFGLVRFEGGAGPPGRRCVPATPICGPRPGYPCPPATYAAVRSAINSSVTVAMTELRQVIGLARLRRQRSFTVYPVYPRIPGVARMIVKARVIRPHASTRKTFVLARGTRRFADRGDTTMTLRLSSRTRRHLDGVRRLRVVVRMRYLDQLGRTFAARRAFTMARRSDKP